MYIHQTSSVIGKLIFDVGTSRFRASRPIFEGKINDDAIACFGSAMVNEQFSAVNKMGIRVFYKSYKKKRTCSSIRQTHGLRYLLLVNVSRRYAYCWTICTYNDDDSGRVEYD